MKHFTKSLMMVCLVGSLSACANQETSSNGRNYFDGDECATSAVRPVQQPVYQTTNYGGCQPSEYTVRTPVEVVYKNTTYRTVYVPQTSQSVSYEKRPYNYNEICANGNCTVSQ